MITTRRILEILSVLRSQQGKEVESYIATRKAGVHDNCHDECVDILRKNGLITASGDKIRITELGEVFGHEDPDSIWRVFGNQ